MNPPCGKVCYADRPAAHRAADGLRHRGGQSNRVYHCSRCGGFHLTRVDKSLAKRRQHKWSE